MKAGAEIVGPPPKRVVYELLLAGGNTNSHYHVRWACPACGLQVDECTDNGGIVEARARAQVAAEAHVCDEGWCAVPMTEERQMLAAISPYRFNFTVTAQDRQRWAERQRLNAIARRTADRVIPMPRRGDA